MKMKRWRVSWQRRDLEHEPALGRAARGLRAAVLIALGLAWTGTLPAAAAELWIGGATVDITPDRPVALDGQRNVRISRKVETPLSATALALQSRDSAKVRQSN
ncbi:MAG TPA: hypothetical protein PLF81_00995 [Candidatus Anammoximicrobium sp.]|nr:hypothetical protein [Candidatus Anammoximicrobium sp.]